MLVTNSATLTRWCHRYFGELEDNFHLVRLLCDNPRLSCVAKSSRLVSYSCAPTLNKCTMMTSCSLWVVVAFVCFSFFSTLSLFWLLSIFVFYCIKCLSRVAYMCVCVRSIHERWISVTYFVFQGLNFKHPRSYLAACIISLIMVLQFQHLISCTHIFGLNFIVCMYLLKVK